MDRLSARDLHTVLEVARELAAVRDLEGLHRCLLPQMRRLVAYDAASLNEIAPHAGEAVVTALDPSDVMFDGAEEILGTYARQNPLIAAAQSPRGLGVRKFSDFISARQLHRLDLYDLIYAPMEVEHQIAFTLPAPATHVVGFALSRGRHDFTERDRVVLHAVRPFVVQAYVDATARVRTRATVAALERATDSTSQAVIVLSAGGEIEFTTDLAERWLGELDGADRRLGLPEPVASWSAAQRGRSVDGLPSGERLELHTMDAIVTAQFIPGGRDRLDAILLQQRAPLHTGALRILGLTDREIGVLRLVARGLSNIQISLELSVSERTVAKHLEHIYRKLDVTSRTAAVARAGEASTNPGGWIGPDAPS
jgi:DNA-binding CsgD family transcriptional regulator